MKITELCDRFSLIHRKIEKEITGTPEQFAQQLGVKRRQLLNIISELKMYGAPISYCKKKKTYYYTTAYEIKLELTLHEIPEEDINNISGGFFSQSVILLHQPSLIFAKS